MNDTTTVKKPTKKANYLTIKNILNAAKDAGIELDGEITYDSLNDFVDAEITLLDKKAENARTRAAQKKEDGDALRETVYSKLTEEPMTIRSIVTAIDNPDVTDQMVTSRLTQLVDAGRVVKTMVTVAPTVEGGKSKKLSGYSIKVD